MIGHADGITQFRDFIASLGYEPPERIEPGQFVSFPGQGKRHGNTAGRAKLFPDLEGGMVWDHSNGAEYVWQIKRETPRSVDEQRAFRERCDRAKREADEAKARELKETAERAARIWQESKPADDSHPYLTAKGVRSHGLRIYRGPLVLREMRCNGALIVPRRTVAGDLVSLQFITPEDKRYLNGPQTPGSYFAIGKPEGTICIAEGFATGASIHEATGYAVAIAFDAANLEPTAKALREKFPNARIVICADDDWRVTRNGEPYNPGIEYATKAARAVGGLLAIPEFGPDRAETSTDFNDLAQLHGAEAIQKALQGAQAPAPVSSHTPTPENHSDAILASPQGGSGDSTASKWDNPGEITAPLQPVPEFDPVAMLPDGLREWVMDEADRMPVPPDFVAAPAIVALGSIVGTQCTIKPKRSDDWIVTPNLWGASVGGPSTKKSPGLGAALRPLDRLVAKAIKDHEDRMSVYETMKTVSEAQREAIEGRLKKAAKDNGDITLIADELTRHKASAENAPPILRRYKTNDGTVEKIGELLRDNPNGILMMRDEVVGMIASWEREGREGDRAFNLEAWNGTGSFDTDRIGRGTIFIPNLCLSIYGGIQPDKLTAYLEEASDSLANDGMLQRFQMIVYPDDRRWEWRDRVPVKEARERVNRIFERLSEVPAIEWGAHPADDFVRFPFFRFNDDAQALFIEWTAELHRRIPAENDPLVAQHLAKFDKLFPALALIFHLIDCADRGAGGPVTKAAALRAAAWCEYLEAHARRCYGLLADKGLRAAQGLAQMIGGGLLESGFTSRDVRRKQRRHLKSDEAVHAALEWLMDEGWLRPEEVGGEGPGTGRRTVRYHINPKVVGRARHD